MKKKLLYIGNKLSNSKGTLTTIDTLSVLLKQEGYIVHSVSSIQNKVLRMLDMLFQTFKNRNKVDIVLIDTYSTQNFYYAVLVSRLCRIIKLPYIPILHGGNLPNRLKQSPNLSRKIFSFSKTNIAPSMYLFNAFSTEGYKNLFFIPNTIEIKNYPFLQRKKVSLKLLWVRAFAKLYHPMLAIKIIEQLIEKGFDASLCMVGPEKDGTLAACKFTAEKKKLPVTFTGKLDKLEWISLSKEYDIFINTTNFDNTPVSVIEAMALGLPVISTNVGGLPFLIKTNQTGILVPPNNTKVFVDTIVELYNAPEKVSFLSKNARAKAVSFDWQKVKHQWNDILLE